jgi:hypothetical protein
MKDSFSHCPRKVQQRGHDWSDVNADSGVGGRVIG